MSTSLEEPSSGGRVPLRTLLQNFLNHVDTLEAQKAEGDNTYEKEFQSLKAYSDRLKGDREFRSVAGELDVNRKKNRYKDILPFDFSRVKLSPYDGVAGSDYINASFIKGASGSNAYIASQGPLAHTVNDFWRLVVETEVQVIVMACSETEGGKHKCEKYWNDPEDEQKELQFGNVNVTLIKKRQICPDFLVRTMRIKWKPDDGGQQGAEMQERTVCQFHYSAWPDHSIPTQVKPLLEMVRLIRDCQASETLPVLVHCSAGCGRTGTVCAIDYIWSLLRNGKLSESFSLYDLVKSMRGQRIAMVQTVDQYILVHRAVRELFLEQMRVIDAHPYENVDDDGNPLCPALNADQIQPDYEMILVNNSSDNIAEDTDESQPPSEKTPLLRTKSSPQHCNVSNRPSTVMGTAMLSTKERSSSGSLNVVDFPSPSRFSPSLPPKQSKSHPRLNAAVIDSRTIDSAQESNYAPIEDFLCKGPSKLYEPPGSEEGAAVAQKFKKGELRLVQAEDGAWRLEDTSTKHGDARTKSEMPQSRSRRSESGRSSSSELLRKPSMKKIRAFFNMENNNNKSSFDNSTQPCTEDSSNTSGSDHDAQHTYKIGTNKNSGWVPKTAASKSVPNSLDRRALKTSHRSTRDESEKNVFVFEDQGAHNTRSPEPRDKSKGEKKSVRQRLYLPNRKTSSQDKNGRGSKVSLQRSKSMKVSSSDLEAYENNPQPDSKKALNRNSNSFTSLTSHQCLSKSVVDLTSKENDEHKQQTPFSSISSTKKAVNRSPLYANIDPSDQRVTNKTDRPYANIKYASSSVAPSNIGSDKTTNLDLDGRFLLDSQLAKLHSKLFRNRDSSKPIVDLSRSLPTADSGKLSISPRYSSINKNRSAESSPMTTLMKKSTSIPSHHSSPSSSYNKYEVNVDTIKSKNDSSTATSSAYANVQSSYYLNVKRAVESAPVFESPSRLALEGSRTGDLSRPGDTNRTVDTNRPSDPKSRERRDSFREAVQRGSENNNDVLMKSRETKGYEPIWLPQTIAANTKRVPKEALTADYEPVNFGQCRETSLRQLPQPQAIPKDGLPHRLQSIDLVRRVSAQQPPPYKEPPPHPSHQDSLSSHMGAGNRERLLRVANAPALSESRPRSQQISRGHHANDKGRRRSVHAPMGDVDIDAIAASLSQDSLSSSLTSGNQPQSSTQQQQQQRVFGRGLATVLSGAAATFKSRLTNLASNSESEGSDADQIASNKTKSLLNHKKSNSKDSNSTVVGNSTTSNVRSNNNVPLRIAEDQSFVVKDLMQSFDHRRRKQEYL